MKARVVYLIALLVLIATFLAWLLLSLRNTEEDQSDAKPTERIRSPKEDSPEKRQQDAVEPMQQRPDPAKLLKAILNSKIVFYGQVLDQNNEPVPGAKIRYSALDEAGFAKVWNEGVPKKTIFADKDGRFDIVGKGGSLNVYVSREGYYKTNESGGGFTYGMPSGREPARDPDNPAIFRLHKKGETEPLYFFDGPTPISSWLPVPSGRTVRVDLTTGKLYGTGSQNMVYISQRNNRQPKRIPNEQRPHYDWKFTLKVPGGGFIRRDGRFDFIAPEDGYEEEVYIGMEKNDPDWKTTQEHEYFVRFPNGTYGRFWIRANVTHFVYRSHYNPTGSRNLEYDPDKRIRVR